ncbi:hypothetical protein PybrP1_010321 [[Pythium] brassicae (nom. inval.)]|nr:hypothetical protein PybrP1_010321 [[Pythium] brassicae (nom. inval.)]
MYVGMNSPLVTHDAASTAESSAVSPPPPEPPTGGAHGALRDDDLDHFRGSSAPLTAAALRSFTRRGSKGSRRHSGSSAAAEDPPPMLHGGGASSGGPGSSLAGGPLSRLTSETLGAPPVDKKRSFYALARGRLRGAEPPVPRWFLGATYRANSFFARRLLGVALPLGAAMAAGLGFYYLYKPRALRLNPAGQPDAFGFQLARPSAVYTFQASPCENMVGFSALIYHALPAVVVLALPASGLRAFEPFKRDSPDSSNDSNNDSPDSDSPDNPDNPDSNRKKIRRTLAFQACEAVAVLVFAFALVAVLFFLHLLFNGGAFSCGSGAVQAFAGAAVLCFLGLVAELRAFARFREHVKMLLGAFHESDQTGDVRHHVLDTTGLDQLQPRLDHVRKQLFSAARLGDLRALRAALARAAAAPGFSPQRAYSDARIVAGLIGRSRKNPMHVAAARGDLAALALLRAHGFDVNALDKVARVRFSTGDLFWYFARFVVATPAAAERGDESSGAASVFKTTLVTPLHCAVANGQLGAVQWLLAHGADVGAVARSTHRAERVPPLFLAEHADIVRALLAHGADQLAIPDPGFMNTLTALQLAYLRGNYAVAQALEDAGGDVALTPFHAAAARNDALAVRKFVRAKTAVDCLGEHGYVGLNRRTPLHWAAVNGAAAVVELLLEAGADPNFQDARGRSPLHWAARLNRVEVVRCLLAKGAQPGLADLDLLTPLVCAAFARDASRELFAALVAAGADVNYQLPTSGDTALHVAVREENEAAALAVLACGGNIMKMNAEGLRPLDCSTSTTLLFAVKRAAGHRDVMISYTHSHAEFAKKLRQSLEDANVTTWLDLMDPSGIGGGAVWREEIARGITNAALVVCILTEDYAQSEWCLKELALAKQAGTPIVAVSTEGVRIGEDLQVYLYTRQIVPFEPAITATRRPATAAAPTSRQIEYEYDDRKYQAQFRLLLDGVRDEIEKRRNAAVLRNRLKAARSSTTGASLALAGGGGGGFSRVFQPWDATGAATAAAAAAATPPAFVFLSHGDKHPRFVQQLYEELSDAGVACYGDRSVAGESFASRIHVAQEAILACAGFVVVLSSQTIGSELVRDQLAFAEDKGRPIFPVVLNDLDVALDQQYSLARNDLFHFLATGMGFKASFERLLAGIQRTSGDTGLLPDPTTASLASGTTATAVVGAPTTTAAARSNHTVTSFVSLDMESEGYDSDQYGGLTTGEDMAFASFNLGGGAPTGQPINPYTATAVIMEDAEVYGAAPNVPVTPSTEPQQGDTRNFESLSSIEDGKLDLSSTRVRM